MSESVYENVARLVEGIKPRPRRELHCGWLVPYYLHCSREIAQETDFLALGKVGDLLAISVFVEQGMPSLDWEIREGDAVVDSGHIGGTAEVLREMGD